jgi:hypothetical protein
MKKGDESTSTAAYLRNRKKKEKKKRKIRISTNLLLFLIYQKNCSCMSAYYHYLLMSTYRNIYSLQLNLAIDEMDNKAAVLVDSSPFFIANIY